MRPVISSLNAFLAAGARPRTLLAKAIMLVLVIKLVGIADMILLTYPKSAASHVDAAATARMIGLTSAMP